jgi:hypothetical protein
MTEFTKQMPLFKLKKREKCSILYRLLYVEQCNYICIELEGRKRVENLKAKFNSIIERERETVVVIDIIYRFLGHRPSYKKKSSQQFDVNDKRAFFYTDLYEKDWAIQSLIRSTTTRQ